MLVNILPYIIDNKFFIKRIPINAMTSVIYYIFYVAYFFYLLEAIKNEVYKNVYYKFKIPVASRVYGGIIFEGFVLSS